MWRRVRRVLLVTLLLALAVVVVLVSLKAIRLAGLADRTADAATTALRESRDGAAQDHADLVRAATRDLGSAPTHSAAGYRCSIISRDRGLFVDHYAQKCHWSFVEYFAAPDPQALAGRHALSGSRPQDCPLLFLPAFEDDYTVTAPLVPADRDEARCGELPSVETLRPWVRWGEPTELVLERDVEVVQGVPGSGEDWVILTSYSDFLEEDLGCGFGIVFCNRPLGEVAMPRR